MARKFNKKIPEKWIVFPQDKDIQLLITKFSYTYLTIMPTQDSITPAMTLDMFTGSVKNWKGILGEDDKLLKCNRDNKLSVALQDNEIMIWAISEILSFSKLEDKKEEEVIKN